LEWTVGLAYIKTNDYLVLHIYLDEYVKAAAGLGVMLKNACSAGYFLLLCLHFVSRAIWPIS
jgi:hypothetical protein